MTSKSSKRLMIQLDDASLSTLTAISLNTGLSASAIIRAALSDREVYHIYLKRLKGGKAGIMPASGVPSDLDSVLQGLDNYDPTQDGED